MPPLKAPPSRTAPRRARSAATAKKFAKSGAAGRERAAASPRAAAYAKKPAYSKKPAKPSAAAGIWAPASSRAAHTRKPAPPRAVVEAPPKPLTAAQKRHLRSLAHALKPVILVGQKGITPALLQEFDGALLHHELVKVKLADDDRESRSEAIESIRTHSGAELVQTIGKVACFYKRNPERAQYPLP